MAILIFAFALALSALLPVRVEASDSLMVVHLEYIRKDISEVKADISRLETDMAELKTEVKGVKADISELKADMNRRFDDVDKRIAANTDRLFLTPMVVITVIGAVITAIIGVIVSIWLAVRPAKTPNAPRSTSRVNESLETQNALSEPSIATPR